MPSLDAAYIEFFQESRIEHAISTNIKDQKIIKSLFIV